MKTALAKPVAPHAVVDTRTAGVVHDLNNILAVVLGAAEAVAGDRGMSADLAELVAAAERGRALVGALLRPGTVDLPPVARGLDEMIRGLGRALGRACGTGTRLRLELAASGLRVAIAPMTLERVLLNLVVNARDAMDGAGSIVLRSFAQPRGTPGGRSGAVIEVCDTGPGIAPDILARIGEPYFTTKPVGQGSGLGLATSRRLLAEVGGFLTLESTPETGTVVAVHLAAIAAIEASTERRVLLVEDEAALLQLTARALSRAGWDVLPADSAEAALTLLDAGDVDLAALVTDVWLPGMDGERLAHEVRQRLGRDSLPVVLVSGFIGDSVSASGMVRLAKPYAAQDLAALLASLLPARAP